VIPAATAEFDYRYLLPVVPFACLAAAMVFGAGNPVGDRLAARRQRRRSAAGSAPRARESAPATTTLAEAQPGGGMAGDAGAVTADGAGKGTAGDAGAVTADGAGKGTAGDGGVPGTAGTVPSLTPRTVPRQAARD